MFKDLFSNRLFIGTFAFFILCVGGSLLYMQHVERTTARDLAETQERIKTETEKQKPTSPVPVAETSQGGHFHGGHFHADGTFHAEPHETANASDWRDTAAFEAPPPTNDPWKQNAPEQETTAAETDDDAYPPEDWYKTKDPELRAEYLYAQLINQFGDTPEVQAIGDYELKAAQGTPPTLDEYLSYLEAHYRLFPNENNRRTLEELRNTIDAGGELIFK